MTTVKQDYYRAMADRLPETFRLHDWQFSGFQRRILQLLAQDEPGDYTQEQESILVFLPDAYAIEVEKREILLLEIVDTSDITDTKAEQFTEFFWMMDAISWELTVICFHPRHRSVLIVRDWFLMDGYVARFEGRPKPYRDAFRILQCAA